MVLLASCLPIRCVVVAAICLSGSMAFAAASSVPTDYEPDPALRTASRTELQARIRRACTATQARLQNAAEISLAGACGCYAERTLQSLDETELGAYRRTGVFNDSARAKALTALDTCRLPRPV